MLLFDGLQQKLNTKWINYSSLSTADIENKMQRATTDALPALQSTESISCSLWAGLQEEVMIEERSGEALLAPAAAQMLEDW